MNNFVDKIATDVAFKINNTMEGFLQIALEDYGLNKELVYEFNIAKIADAINRNVPKKPKRANYSKSNAQLGSCPHCNNVVMKTMSFCSSCGQKLDWTLEETWNSEIYLKIIEKYPKKLLKKQELVAHATNKKVLQIVTFLATFIQILAIFC